MGVRVKERGEEEGGGEVAAKMNGGWWCVEDCCLLDIKITNAWDQRGQARGKSEEKPSNTLPDLWGEGGGRGRGGAKNG